MLSGNAGFATLLLREVVRELREASAAKDARIEELCLELESMIGRPVLSIPREDGERAILALGEDVGLLRAVTAFLGNGSSRPRIVPIPSLTPFHREALADACRGSRRVVVLERALAGTPLTDRVHAVVTGGGTSGHVLPSGIRSSMDSR